MNFFERLSPQLARYSRENEGGSEWDKTKYWGKRPLKRKEQNPCRMKN